MAAGIYRLFCAVSGKSYVGQSVNVARRVEVHFRLLHEGQHYNVHLQHSFDLHGHDTFLAEVLEYCDREVLKEREQFWMDHYGFENLYNMCPAAGSPAGLKHSDEARKKISESMKGKKHSDEARRNISEAHKGKKLSDETRRNMSEAHKGKKLSDETRQRMSENHVGMKGRTHSEETRRRMSESTKAWRARQKAEKEATQ